MKKISDDIIYGRQALRACEPWIVPESLDYLNSIIQPIWNVFEWGAGGSTVYFGKKCASVISIEGEMKWRDNIAGKAKAAKLSNVSILYIPVNDGTANPDAILKYEPFDLVFVDGDVRVRDRCLENAWDKVVDGGYVMLDNSNWWKGSIPDGWSRVDFHVDGLRWIGEPKPFDWWTSIFKKGEM